MNRGRYIELQWGKADQLTEQEMLEGWHWCSKMDDLLCIYGGDDCFCHPDKKCEEDADAEVDF